MILKTSVMSIVLYQSLIGVSLADEPENAVKALTQRRVEDWKSKNWKSLADDFVDRGELIGIDSRRYVGKEQITAYYKKRLEGDAATTKATFETVHVHMPSETLMIAEAKWHSTSEPGVVSHGESLMILVNQEGKWRIASLRVATKE